jgi:hypothetical protein
MSSTACHTRSLYGIGCRSHTPVQSSLSHALLASGPHGLCRSHSALVLPAQQAASLSAHLQGSIQPLASKRSSSSGLRLANCFPVHATPHSVHAHVGHDPYVPVACHEAAVKEASSGPNSFVCCAICRTENMQQFQCELQLSVRRSLGARVRSTSVQTTQDMVMSPLPFGTSPRPIPAMPLPPTQAIVMARMRPTRLRASVTLRLCEAYTCQDSSRCLTPRALALVWVSRLHLRHGLGMGARTTAVHCSTRTCHRPTTSLVTSLSLFEYTRKYLYVCATSLSLCISVVGAKI